MSETMSSAPPPEIGVTLEGDINRTLKKIKARTGLSVSRLANVGLAFLGPRILKGEFQIVNGKVVPAHEAGVSVR